jgi:hypothetical protein
MWCREMALQIKLTGKPFGFSEKIDEQPEYDAPNVTTTTYAEYEAQIIDQCRQAWGRAVSRARALGAEKTPAKRTPEHYEWLARYQCGNKSMRDIWRDLPDQRKYDAVKRAIERAATEIDLTLRKER